MTTIDDAGGRESLCRRIEKLRPDSPRQWGKMTPHEMVCHLNDSFLVAAGEKYASPDTNFLKQSALVKWIALRSGLPWPHGAPTRPELLQGKGGTPPSDWAGDVGQLISGISSFATREKFGLHPIFGPMKREEWLIWAYRHIDHHLRQFAV